MRLYRFASQFLWYHGWWVSVFEFEHFGLESPILLDGNSTLRFDLELSRSFQGAGDIGSLTHHCQTYIHDNWHGFAPPGSCTIIPLPEGVRGPNKNPWHTTSLAILPTMHTPENVSWHKDLVYNAMWTLLVEIQRWNQSAGVGKDEVYEITSSSIRTVLMTGLGTGQGGISAKRCAQQMVLAVKHFQQGLPINIGWEDVRQRNADIERTMEL